MNFSLILATRHRPDLLSSLLSSIEYTAAEPKQIEVIAIFDLDDDITWHRIGRMASHFAESLKITAFARTRSKWLNDDYLNFGAKLSTGKYLIALNDDTQFRTHHWDKIVYERCEEYLRDKPDGIVYGAMGDSLDQPLPRYSCFPLISRKAVDVLGYFMPPYFASWGADLYLHNCYKPTGRILDLTDVEIRHDCYHTRSRERDNTSYHVETISSNIRHHDLNGDVRKLLEALR